MRFGGIRQFLCVLGLMGFVLSGCSDPEPREPEPTASPTSTLTVPPLPEQANDDSPEGAAAFASHFISTLSDAISSRQSAGLVAISHQKCEGCQRYIDQIVADRKSSTEIVGFDWSVKSVQPSANGPVQVTVGSSPYRIRRGSQEWRDVPGNEYKVVISRSLFGSRWLATSFEEPAS